MPAPRNRRHLLVRTAPQTEAYTPHPRRVPPVDVPPPDNRRRHAATLRTALNQAQRDTQATREQRAITVHGAVPGVYVQFESTPGIDLKLESLEHKSKGIEVVAVQRVTQDGAEIERATVFIPDG